MVFQWPIESISAITLATHNMSRAVGFYRMLGFEIVNGGSDAAFTSFRDNVWLQRSTAVTSSQKVEALLVAYGSQERANSAPEFRNGALGGLS